MSLNQIKSHLATNHQSLLPSTKKIVVQFQPTIDLFPSPLFERVIRKQLVTFLESNDLLCSHRHGCRSGHSCLTQLQHHFDDVLENYLVGADTDSIYLDYAKAFDNVDHALLIKKAPKIWYTSPSCKLDKIISL